MSHLDGLLEQSDDTGAGVMLVDWIVVVLYLVCLAGVVILVNRMVGTEDSERFFLGGRSMPWWAIGCSLFASNLGTDHLVGLAGSGAAQGLAVGNYEWSATYTLLLLGWYFVPHYLSYKIYTVPEYLEKRYSKGFRNFFMVFAILTTFFTKITVTLFAAAVVLKEVLGWNMAASSITLLTLTTCYTSIGGLAAVVFTEVLQSAILILGSIVLLVEGMRAAGGWDGLQSKLDPGHFVLLKPLSDRDYPWLGVLVGMPINSIWYWCCDQVMVQRVLGTDRLAEAQKGCLVAGWLKVLPMYIMVLPGLIAAALYPSEIAQDSNVAFPLLVKRVLTPGWYGVMIAVMLSSFMAALASCFNSCSTLFTMDVYRHIVPDASEQQLVLAGRGFTILVALLSLAWLPVIDNAKMELFLYIQGMQVIWAGPVVVVFIASTLSQDVKVSTAWVTLVSGVTLGFLFWIVHDALPDQGVPQWLAPVRRLSILHFTIILTVVSASIAAATHNVGKKLQHRTPTEESRLIGSEADNRRSEQAWASRAVQGLAALLVATVVALTLVHSFFWPR